MGFDDFWGTASADGGDDNAPPDGRYDVALIDAGAFTSKKGNDVAKLEFQTVDKTYNWTSILGFENAKQTGFSKGQCLKIGVNVDHVGSLEELDSALKECCGGFYEVAVERNGEYLNTYVEEGQRPDVPAERSEPAAVGSTDDIPWS